MKIIKKITVGFLVLVFVALGFLLIISPGKTSPILDQQGKRLPKSIAVIERPMIGGIPQGLIIRGNDTSNPVLLFLHGGPGIPAFSSVKKELGGLEKIFTVCYWEQRGAGMSYSGKLNAASMTTSQLSADAAEVTHYLLKKFNKQKIYLLGHSWGTYLGSLVIHEHPELYAAYLGIGQIANSYPSEQESYAFALSEAIRRKDRSAETALKKLSLPSKNASGKEWWEYYQAERDYVFKFGGSVYGKPRNTTAIKKAILFCREYTLMDKIHFAQGVAFSQIHLDKEVINADLNVELPEQKIPVYIFQGLHDKQTSYVQAKLYFDKLVAPEKHFYTFAHSAHLPHVQEYDLFEKIVRENVLHSKATP